MLAVDADPPWRCIPLQVNMGRTDSCVVCGLRGKCCSRARSWRDVGSSGSGWVRAAARNRNTFEPNKLRRRARVARVRGNRTV